MAPPRKPAGTQQGHREQKALTLVPEAVTEAPDAPEGLLPESVARWEAFWASEVAQAVDPKADLHRLERWIEYVDEWNRIRQVVKNERVTTGSTGQMVLSPLISYMKSLEDAISKAENEFGMTPKARNNLGIAMGQAALTAAQVNKMIEQPSGPSPVADIEGFAEEYEEA